MKFMRIYALLALLALVLGCGKNRCTVVPGEIRTNSCEISYHELADSEKIAIIGNLSTTKGEIEREKNAYLASLKVHKPEEYQNHLKDRCRTVIGSLVAKFLYQSAMELEADALGITPKSVFISEGWNSVSNFCKNSKISYSKFISSYNGGEEALRAKIAADARVKTLFDSKFEKKLEVKDEEVEKLYQSIVDGNAESAETNKLYAAEMLELRRKIIRDRIVFDENAENNWMPSEYEVDFFIDAPVSRFDDEEKFAVMANQTAIGEWSAVVDSGDTIDIFHITNVVPRTAKSPALYSGVRIFREKDHGYILPEKTQLKSDMRQRRNISVVTPYVNELKIKYGVTFPYGFIWNNIKSSTSRKGSRK